LNFVNEVFYRMLFGFFRGSRYDVLSSVPWSNVRYLAYARSCSAVPHVDRMSSSVSSHSPDDNAHLAFAAMKGFGSGAGRWVGEEVA